MSPSRAVWRAALVALAASGVSGCGGNLSALDPAGPAAASTATLWWAMLAGASAIFLLVCGLLALALLRHGLGAAVPPQRWLVWGGLAFPGVVLSVLLVFALAVGERLLAHPASDVFTVEAVPERWLWRFRHPGGAQTEGVLHIPAGRPVDVRVTGADVIHAFWVPRLGGKIDALPGRVNRLRIQADRPGTYGGVCAEFCGTGHTGMTFTVQAHDEAGLAAALATAGDPTPPPATEATR